VFEVATAIKFLRMFPPASDLACTAAHSLCSILGSSSHLTPGPALKERLKHTYYRSASPSKLQLSGDTELGCLGTTKCNPDDLTRASFSRAWEWVKVGTEERVKEWRKVGVAVDDVMELVKRARSGGAKLDRLVDQFLGPYGWTAPNVQGVGSLCTDTCTMVKTVGKQ
jgi:hypothetical protein